MKCTVCTVPALSLLSGPVAMADRPGSRRQWRNPDNDHRGEVRIGGYYNDPRGFRCADFTQVTTVGGRTQTTRGRACRQPDGSWAVVG